MDSLFPAPAGCRVHLASGRLLAARAVVYTPANRRAVVPAWARQLAEPPQPCTPPADPCVPAEPDVEGACGASGRAEAKQGVGVEQQARLPAGIATSDAVQLRDAELEGRRVVVVGGGMAAGLLAAGAAERGADVALVCRRCGSAWPGRTCTCRFAGYVTVPCALCCIALA